MTPGIARILPTVLLLALVAATVGPASAKGEDGGSDHPGRRCDSAAPGASSLDPACLAVRSGFEQGAFASAEAGGKPGYARVEVTAHGGVCASAQTEEIGRPKAAEGTCAALPTDAPRPAPPSDPGTPGSGLRPLVPTLSPPTLSPPMLSTPTLSLPTPSPPAASPPRPPPRPGAPEAQPPRASPPVTGAPLEPPAGAAPQATLGGSVHVDEDDQGEPTARLGLAAAAPGVTAARAERVGERPGSGGDPGTAGTAGAASHAAADAPADADPAVDTERAQGAGRASGAAPDGGPEQPDPTRLRVAEATRPPSTEASKLALVAQGMLAPGLAAAASLYHRLRRSELLTHATRARIAEALASAPMTATQLAATLGVHRKTVEYHLRLLRAYGLVSTWSAGRERLFAPAHVRAGDGLSPSARRVLDAVRTQPGLGVSALARILALSKGTLHHHVASLAARGLVRVERLPRGVGIHPR